jgi:glyoxylase-like metal-dependent hydrolase (beta-lactamase superfamily II)
MGLKLFALTCGYLNLRTAFLIDGVSGRIEVPVPAYLIEHPRGRALFDTGLHARFQRFGDQVRPSRNVELTESMDIAARLRAMAIDPASIRWIVNSHLHGDHCGGNALIPNATVIVQASEWDFAPRAEDTGYTRHEFDTGQPVTKLQGDHDLFSDGSVVLFPTPGHTPGHQSARVRLRGGEVVLAGDCCNMRASLDQLRLPDHAHDADAYLRSLLHLRDLRANGVRIFYGRDPDFWRTVPQAEALG